MARLLVFCFLQLLFVVIADAADPALVLYLPLDEGEGKFVNDISKNRNNGELADNPNWVKGKFGRALEFSGGNRVHIPASESLHGDIFKSPFTLLAWVNPTMTGDQWQHIWRSVDGANLTQCTLFLNTGGFFSWRGSIGGTWGERCATPAGMVKADQWTHVAVAGDKKEYKIYINGVEAVTSIFEEMDGGITDFYLAFDDRQWAEKYSGVIDEVYILTRAMTAAEIKAGSEGIMTQIISVQPAGRLSVAWGHVKDR